MLCLFDQLHLVVQSEMFSLSILITTGHHLHIYLRVVLPRSTVQYSTVLYCAVVKCCTVLYVVLLQDTMYVVLLQDTTEQ
jgi:hypothetical protein